MARTHRGRPSAPSSSELHRSWLELVDSEGPFLAIPPLKRVWPNGIPDFRTNHPDRFTAFVDAKKDFEQAWERVDQNPDDDRALSNYREVRDEWVQTILREVTGWRDSLTWGETSGIEAQSPNHNVTIAPQGVLSDLDGNNAALVYVIDPVESLRETPNDGWAATPIDRMEELLRVAKVPIGIVTDGRWWGVVSYKTGNMPASGVVDSITWIEEPRTRDAFLTILGRQYLIGGDPNERLPVLFEESIAAAEEITEALGVQVRSAVELLVQSFSESALEAESRGQPDPLPERSRDVYEAAVTVMMRTVFLLFAEERGMLPAGELFEQSYGLVGRLERLSRREAEEGEEALDTTSMTWHRLLATSNAIYSGATFENLRMPAYGGSLFDPARFPWLTATTEDGTLAIAVSDRVMLHVLRSVQLAQLKAGEVRQISFRDIDVEQIGYIYEGLLGYTATRVNETYVGLKGAAGAEPEIPLATLEKLHQENPDPKKFAATLQEWVSNDQPAAKTQTAAATAKGLNAEIDPSLVSALSQAVGGNSELRDRIKPFLGIIRQDLRSHPFVVLPGGLLLKETPSRKNAGAHYTPKSLAEEVVLYALQPLCYSPGPHQTGDETEWKLRPSEEILDLKVADIACGSGAFLVAAARYLADRIVEAWIAEDPDNAHRKDLHLRAIRQVVANCLYGADINEMAVEMAKLSLWLVSLDRDLPFSFVDDKIFLGNSLLGLTSLDQLRALHIDPANASGQDVLSYVDVDVDAVIRKAIELRERLASEIDEDDPMRSTTAKRRQYEQFQAVTKELRLLADGVIAAGLPLGGKPGNALNEAYQNLRLAVKKAQPVSVGGENDPRLLQSIIHSGLTPTVETDYERWVPLHWVLEAPDVFIGQGGFNAVVGNPAFLHSKKITTAFGKSYRDWLQTNLAAGKRGDADLAAYFLLRQADLVRMNGTIGLVVTKSILQSNTKAVGLDQVLAESRVIWRASEPFDWGPKGASVSVVLLWFWPTGSVIDGEGPLGEPQLLSASRHPPVFVGTYPNGEGFRVPVQTAQAWLREEPSYSRRLRPYIRAADLSQGDPADPSEYLIDLDGLSEAEAKSFGPLWSHLLVEQRPWRMRASVKPRLRERWWSFESSASALYQSVSNLEKVLAIPRTSNLLMPRWVPSTHLYDMGVVVFATTEWKIYAQIASSLHYHWTLAYAATTRDDPSYAPKRVAFTFPWSATEGHNLGTQEFERQLEALCQRMGGLRPVMNEFSSELTLDRHVLRLRDAFIQLDMEVLELFGWSDLTPTYAVRACGNLKRFTVDVESQVELQRRLLERNHEFQALDASDATLDSRRKNFSYDPNAEVLFK